MTARLYGLLDCARDPALLAHAERLEGGGAGACLFAGRLAPEVRAACPFLVELAPDDPLSTAWRGQGWGGAWGSLLSARADSSALLRRLRRLAFARLPDGSGPVLFRFWDPRVLRCHLPLVEPDGLADWFGDVARWIVETPDGAGSLRFSLAGGVLQTATGPPPAR